MVKMNTKFDKYRKLYPVFEYKSFFYKKEKEWLKVWFEFVCGDLKFQATQTFMKKDFYRFDELSKEQIDILVFNIGMIELISYWKATCSPKIIIKPFKLSEKQINFRKKIYFYGLWEFFFVNNIKTDYDSFVEIIVESNNKAKKQKFSMNDDYIVPIWWWKDSVVSLELLRASWKNIRPLIVNPRWATIECAKLAWFEMEEVIEIKREIDPNLLELNKKWFLNWHTPFSAMLAFTTLLASAFTGIKNIALSNENSANESTVKWKKINHQYSKSLEFENDFREYVNEFISNDFNYFSFLRPLSEIHIAKLFSQLEYDKVFKSCNVGSKQNIWCGKCPKCLFTYIILSPFMDKVRLNNIFNKKLFEDKELKQTFLELVGKAESKPFECVWTIKEINIAISLRIAKYGIDKNEHLLKLWSQLDSSKKYQWKNWNKTINHIDMENNLSKELLSLYDNSFVNIKKAKIIKDFSEKSIVILWFGREWESSYKFFRRIFPDKTIYIADENTKLSENKVFKKDKKVKFILWKDCYNRLWNYDIIIKTPGISMKKLPKNIESNKVSSQTDIFLKLFHDQVIGISWTKWKSTTSSLIYKIFKDQDKNTLIAGNIWLPLFDIIDEINENTKIVLELSSHQLQNITIAPKTSVLLNIYQEHLDHYNSYEEYQESKMNLLKKQLSWSYFLYHKSDEIIEKRIKKIKSDSKLISFDETKYNYRESKYLVWDHNKWNILAALQVSKIYGLDQNKAEKSAMSFKWLPHRLAFVGTVNWIKFYNDSISTIPQATIAALKSLWNVDTLILWWMDRGIDYLVLKDGLKEFEVKNIAFVWDAGKRIYEILNKNWYKINHIISNDYKQIVKWCKENTEKWKICLLSPAAPSYDMFKNFEERGNLFSKLVLNK